MGSLHIALLAVLAVNEVLSVLFVVKLLRAARGELSRTFRAALQVAAALGVVLVFGFARMASIALVATGTISASFESVLLRIGVFFILSAAAMAMVVAARSWVVFKEIAKADRMVAAFADEQALDLAASEIGLTAREYDVLATIAMGRLSNFEISAALYISPETASGYVSGILKKAHLGNRRDLLLIDGLVATGSGGGGSAF